MSRKASTIFMNKAHIIPTAVALLLSLLPACRQTGAVNAEMLRETICSQRIAVTPHQPEWVTEERDTHPVSDADLPKLRNLLSRGSARFVPEQYYRDEEEGNRGDTSSELFYLYGDNYQCLGGRVIDEQVYMDDLELTEETRKALYTLLQPYLQKLPKEKN